jgi:hypothetical protein
MSIEFNFTPELHLVDGRIIRNIENAMHSRGSRRFARGARRDEVLHTLEQAWSIA